MKNNCFLPETGSEEDVAKFLRKDSTSDNADNYSKAAALEAAELTQVT